METDKLAGSPVTFGIDVPLVRQCEQQLVFRRTPTFTMLYRGYSVFAVVHEVDSELVAEWSGVAVLADGQIRLFDKVTSSEYEVTELQPFIQELAKLVKALVDHQWSMETPEVQALGQRYEAHMRTLKAKEASPLPEGARPVLN